MVEESIEYGLELINFLIALIILCLGCLAVRRFSLLFQKRAGMFFLAAIAFFASSEMLAVACFLYPFPGVELVKEFTESGFVLSLFIALVMLRRSDRHEITSLRHWATTDGLTGLYNHAYFRRAAQRRLRQALKHNFPIALILLDIDNFKAYNDTFGHESGNFVLQSVADVLRVTARADDIVARYGGEEFVMVMSASVQDAVKTAERIRVNIESHCDPLRYPKLQRQITVSVGLAHTESGIASLDELIKQADREMYRAKQAGKNCVRAGARCADVTAACQREPA